MANEAENSFIAEDNNISISSEDLVVENVTGDNKPALETDNPTSTTDDVDADDSFLMNAMEQVKQDSINSFMELSDFKVFRSISNTKGGNSTPSIGIVYTPRNGKRLSVSNALFDLLGQPKELAIAFTDTQLALGSELPMEAQKYSFSPNKYAHIIYRSAVVQQIIKQFGLDFRDITSKSYTDIRLDSFTNELGVVVPVAIVTMK